MNKLKLSLLIFSLLLLPLCLFSQQAEMSISEQFSQDTARIESKFRASTDYSTMGMIAANIELENDYDVLLNKYYKILLSTLNGEEKKILIESQRNWIKLRDSDQKVIGMLREKAYQEAGGGTIWGIVSSGASTDITKQRVIQIFNFLMFDNLSGE